MTTKTMIMLFCLKMVCHQAAFVASGVQVLENQNTVSETGSYKEAQAHEQKAKDLHSILKEIGDAEAEHVQEIASYEAAAVDDEPAAGTPAATKAKWDDMDDFVGTIFVMACKNKNGKDIAGLAAEKLKNGTVVGATGYGAEVKRLQAANVRGLKRTCGMTVSEGTKTCREGCAANWHAKSAFQRDNCDEKCLKVYKNFERSCDAKVENLVKVYDQKREKEAAQEKCYKGLCAEFPAVWMKEGAVAMQEEVDAECTSRCTSEKGAAHIESVCNGKWSDNVADSKAKHESTCSESTKAKTCMATKTQTISGEYATCKTTKGGTCDSDVAECKTKGKTDKTFKDAGKFCDDRHKMCHKETEEVCLKAQKASLEKGETDCEKEAAAEVKKCLDDALTAGKSSGLEACKTKEAAACSTGCQHSCQTGKMITCLQNVASEDTAATFCEDFWHLLHTSSETDPVTGDPIALLSQKASFQTIHRVDSPYKWKGITK